VYIDHAENTLDKQGEETVSAGLDSHAEQGYAPTRDWFARQDRPPVWLANQGESRGAQNGPALLMPNSCLA
jgi:hypothetical protein